MNSQFLTTAAKGTEASTKGDYLGLSLSVMVSKNINGMTPDTEAKLEAMSKYIEANPETTNKQQFNAYREKLATSSAKQYTVTTTARPAGVGITR